MHRPRPAGRQQRVFRRDAAAFGDGDARRAGHVLGDHVMHAIGRAIRRDAKLPGQPPERRRGCPGIDPHRPAKEEPGIEIAQRQIGIRHRRRRAAAPVAGRPGLRPAALRPDI